MNPRLSPRKVITRLVNDEREAVIDAAAAEISRYVKTSPSTTYVFSPEPARMRRLSTLWHALQDLMDTCNSDDDWRASIKAASGRARVPIRSMEVARPGEHTYWSISWERP